MATLNELIDKVRGQIRDKGEPPVFARAKPATEDQAAVPDELEEFVLSAISDYSGFRPFRKPGVLQVAASQIEYTMPGDFLAVAEFPLSHVVSGTMLYLNSLPAQSSSIKYWYRALHTPQTIPPSDLPPIIWLASALALRAIVADPQRLKQYASYKIPDVFETNTENATEIGKDLLKTATDYEKQYLARVDTQIEQQERKPRPFSTFG